MNAEASADKASDAGAGDDGAGGGRRRPGAGVVAAVVVAVAALTSAVVVGRMYGPPSAVPLAVDVVVGVVSCAGAALSLWRPMAGTLALTALAVVSPAATPAAQVGTLQVAHRHRLPVALGVAAAGVCAHVVQGLWRPNTGISYAWWLLLVTASYGALVGWGALVRSHRALLASVHERARRAEAEQGRRVAEARILERTRIAREMHDVLAHRLSLLATYAGALEYRPDAPPEQLARAAGIVRTSVHQALDELRDVIDVLRDVEPTAGPDAGMRPPPALADLPRLVEESRAAGQPVQLHDAVDDPQALPAAAGRTAYRVVQEALTNARKHAAGQPVRVVLGGGPGDRLTIDVRNHLPPGGATVPVVPGTGTGLVGLTERVRLAGGRLDHEIHAGEFRLRAWLPWPA